MPRIFPRFRAGPGLYKRDFDELRRRDLALFALGDVRGKAVLDVACGSGLHLVLAKMGAFASGQDISEESVNDARWRSRGSLDASLRVGTATGLLFDDASFDGAISGDFVEHISISEKPTFFAEIYRVLPHTCLRIIDIETGEQPMSNENGAVWAGWLEEKPAT